MHIIYQICVNCCLLLSRTSEEHNMAYNVFYLTVVTVTPCLFWKVFFITLSRITATSIQCSICWRRHGFESHLQPFLLTYPELIKVNDVLPSVFIYDMKMETLIAQLKGCLLGCFDWVLNYYIVFVYWCALVGWCDM